MSRLRGTGISSGKLVDMVNHKFKVCAKLFYLIFYSTFRTFTIYQGNNPSPCNFILLKHLLNDTLRQIDNTVNRKSNTREYGLISN